MNKQVNYIISSVSRFFFLQNTSFTSRGTPVVRETQFEKRGRTHSKVSESEEDWQLSRLRAPLWHESTKHTMNYYVTCCLDTNQQQPATRPSDQLKL